MRRRALMLLLGMGVVFGYGGAFASASWHLRHHHDCGAWSDRQWEHGRPGAEAPAPAPQPQTVVVQPAAAPPAAGSQVFIIMPGASSPQVVQAQPATPPATAGR
jgi:hypothetical protein